ERRPTILGPRVLWWASGRQGSLAPPYTSGRVAARHGWKKSGNLTMIGRFRPLGPRLLQYVITRRVSEGARFYLAHASGWDRTHQADRPPKGGTPTNG